MEPIPEPIYRRQRKKQSIIQKEIVRDIFPDNLVVLTEEQIQFYRKAGKYAFAIDRQSLDEVLRDRSKTGQEVRVKEIMARADKLDLNVPMPRENPNWLVGGNPQPGELQYFWDDPPVSPFWFVDGVYRRASGYIINEITRPRLWRAYHTALRLAEHRCAPYAYIVGEPTRFFREEQWISLFHRALHVNGIRLYVEPFGEINDYTKAAYIAYVNAMSGRIREHHDNAREAFLRRGQIPNKRRKFGLLPERDDTYPAQTCPKAWPVLYDMCFQIAEGRLRRVCDVIGWLWETHGVRRSESWLRTLLADQPGILDGTYLVDRYHYTLCTREDHSGLLIDPSVTERGNRRYVRDIGNGTAFPIHYSSGTAPIPPMIVEAARSAILKRRGRPLAEDGPTVARRTQVLLPMSKLRCAKCGSGVEEQNPLPDGKTADWFLRCGIVTRLVQSGDGNGRHAMTREEAKAHPYAQHPQRLVGQVSGPLWEILVEELSNQAPVPRHEAPNHTEQRLAWQKQQQAAEGELANLTTNFLLLKDPSPSVVKITEKKQRELEVQIQDCQRQIELAAASLLEAHHRVETFEHYRTVLRRYLQKPDLTVQEKREVVEAMVEEVIVELDTGRFWAKIRTPVPTTRQGEAQTNNRRCTGASAIIALVGWVRRLIS